VSKRRYIFDLVCPRCKAENQITLAMAEIDTPINCGECLYNDVEIVGMTIIRTTVEEVE